jgi:hypothetical protein
VAWIASGNGVANRGKLGRSAVGRNLAISSTIFVTNLATYRDEGSPTSWCIYIPDQENGRDRMGRCRRDSHTPLLDTTRLESKSVSISRRSSIWQQQIRRSPRSSRRCLSAPAPAVMTQASWRTQRMPSKSSSETAPVSTSAPSAGSKRASSSSSVSNQDHPPRSRRHD